ncbi:MAG: DNRLRE domain-containing protein [Candidatus Auribacterota bacterium]
MKKKRIIILAIFSILSYSSYLSALNVTISPTPADGKDAYIDSSAPTTNYGAASDLNVYNNPSDYELRSLIQFELPTLLNGQNITLARLRLTKSTNTGDITGDLVTAKRVTSSWDEATVTWVTQPTFDSLYENTIPIDDQYTGAIVFDITDMVASWVEGSSANYGVMLVHESAQSGIKTFNSSENGGGSPSLYIEYSSSNTNPVPEPFTILLLLSSIAGLFLKRISIK